MGGDTEAAPGQGPPRGGGPAQGRDDSAEGRDEAADARDVVARRRDEAADRRDQESDSRERRASPDRPISSRDVAADAHDRRAAGNDRQADRADRDAELRDRAAERRDRASEEYDLASEESQGSAAGGGLPPVDVTEGATKARLAAAADRSSSERDRRAGENARSRARTNRDTSRVARDAAGAGRAAAGLNRDASALERSASAGEREHSGHDREGSAGDRADASARREAASLDGLTGAYLRGPGLLELERDVARARRSGEPLTVAFVDVDGLKAVNDRGGHTAGDRLLADVAAALKACFRPFDLVIRYGGDEFVCALAGMAGVAVADRLSQVDLTLAEGPEHGSITAGVAVLADGESLLQLIERADEDLYHQRGQGSLAGAQSVPAAAALD